jgi:ligand-binding SRPBCC domain-containing protein
MKVYHLTRKQFLPVTSRQAWDFFSNAHNLTLITPKRLYFEIVNISGEQKLHAGQIITHKVTILPGIRVKWVSEITNVHEPHYFTDKQKSGPYAYWQHQHLFKKVQGGIEMTDKVEYAIPFGILGILTNSIFVQREVNAIFDYRYTMLEKHFVADTDIVKLV